MQLRRQMSSRSQSTFFVHNAEKTGSKEVSQIKEDNHEEDSDSGESKLDPKSLRLTQRFERVKRDWHQQVSHVLSNRTSRRRHLYQSVETKTLIDRQQEFRPLEAVDPLSALYDSHSNFLKHASNKPSMPLSLGESTILETISNVEKSRFDNFQASENFKQSLRDSQECYRETTTDTALKLWVLKKSRRPRDYNCTLRSSFGNTI